MKLKLDEEKILEAAGKEYASIVKARLQESGGANGPLPEPVDGGEPLNRTGKLIKSLKYNKRTHEVLPDGSRFESTKKGTRRKRRNMAILAINLATRPELAAADPMGVTESMTVEALKKVEEEIARQIAAGEGGITEK